MPNPVAGYIRTFAQSSNILVPIAGVAFVPVSSPIIPIPSNAGIRIVVADVNIFSPDAVAANKKIEVSAMDMTVSLLDSKGGLTVVAVLATLDNTRLLVANGGTVEGCTARMPEPLYMPANIQGTLGVPINLRFDGNADVTNLDGAVARNAVIAIDALWAFEINTYD